MLDNHLQPRMRQTFPVAEAAPSSFELSLKDRLEALRRVFEDEADLGQAAATA